MSGSGIAKVQHYVPQFILRNFGNGKKDQLHVFDKSNNKEFSTNAKNVASESRFYDIEIAGMKATAEPSLSMLESSAKPLFSKLIDADSAAVLTDEEKGLLSGFLAVQFVRTKAHREQWRSLPAMLREQMLKRSNTPEQLKSVEEYFKTPDENEVKMLAIKAMADAPGEFGPHLRSKSWHLIGTSRKLPFYIGDNPLTMQNWDPVENRGSLGLAVRGIELYFPLSPTRALAMWCPSIIESILSADETLQYAKVHQPEFVAQKLKQPEAVEYLAQVIRSNSVIPYTSDNVENFNYLQIRHAERHIYASQPGFELAKQMISDSPSFRAGMRMTIN